MLHLPSVLFPARLFPARLKLGNQHMSASADTCVSISLTVAVAASFKGKCLQTQQRLLHSPIRQEDEGSVLSAVTNRHLKTAAKTRQIILVAGSRPGVDRPRAALEYT